MADSPLSPVSVGTGGGGGVSEVGMNVVVDLHSSASAVLNENSTASTGSTAGIFVPVDLQCPATPQLNLKLPDLSTSSSESDDETALAMALEAGDGLGVRNTSSPPPNCAICLGRCKNKCFTDSCMHQFCFKCLCEWSKVKPECPLCKQTFKSIIHNVKSIDQFEEYHVVTPPTLQFRQTVELNMLRHIETNLRLPYQADNNRRWEDFEVALNNVPRAHRLMRTARTTFYPSSSSSTTSAAASGAGNAAAGAGGTVATTVPNNGNVQNQFVHRGELLDMYRQEYPDAITSGGSLSGTLSQLWRRYVYDRKLYALPVCDITGRFRESSARFYRDNPAQIHRLMPWINRDIVCLLRNTEHDVSFVLERINEWLTMTNILSPLFRRRLQPILGTKTAHFIHELNNFARSPYDMIGYDRAVQYSPQNTEEIVIEFSTSSSSSAGGHTSDDEQVNVVDGGGVGSSVGAVDGTNDAGSAVASTATSRTHRSRSRNTHAQTSASRAREYRVQSRATANTASNTPPMINLLSFTISTTSEGVEAPGVSVATVSSGGRGSQSAAINLSTHNRTSDVIIDLDDTDIDNSTTTTTSTTGVLQYAPPAAGAGGSAALTTPTVTDNIELSSTSSSDECEFVLERKPPHLRTPEMVSLNSESDSDVVFVEEDEDRKPVLHLAEAGASTEDQKKCVTRTMLKKLEATEHEQRSNEQRAKLEDPEEYNVGASTSAGLRSSGRRRRQKSIDMEKNKLKKQERRRRTLRSTKDNSQPGRAESTSSDSDGGNLAAEVAAYREKQRLKRMKKKSSETRRTTRRTTCTTTTTAKSANKTEGPRMIRTTRMRKRKHSVGDEQNDGCGVGGSGRASKERRYADSHTERSGDSDSSNSSPDEMDTALRELSKEFSITIAGLKKRLADNESSSDFTPSNTNNHNRDEEAREEMVQQPVECVVKYKQDEAGSMMQHSSEDNNNERDDNDDEHEEDGSNFTANSLNNMETIVSTTTTAAATEPSSTSTSAATTITTTTSAQQQQTQQLQQQAADDTISLNIHVTSPKTRSSSRSSRSSIYTSSTTTSSESSTTTSSSSSSSTSDDSDYGDAVDNVRRSTTKTFKEESVEEAQEQQQVSNDCYNMMDLETLDAATTEAAAALASLRNSSQQQLAAACRHPYLDMNDNHDANHHNEDDVDHDDHDDYDDDDDGNDDDYNENDDM